MNKLDVDIIEINDEQMYNAKLLASGLSEAHLRKRGMIDILGINCAINYLHAKKIKVSTQKSVYKIPILFEEFKISDIYYNNYRIDVITLYKEKNIKIPKVHIDMDILPNFYFIIQIGSKIKEAKMVGFIEGKSVLSCSHDSKYYYPNLNMLFDINRFFELTTHAVTTKTLLGKHVDCMGLFLKFIDNDLSSVYKRQLIQHLMNCESCRARFIDTIDFEKLSNNIKFYPDLIRKNEKITQIPYVAFDNASNGKFSSFEENLKNIEIKDFEQNINKEDFIDIDKNKNSQSSENTPQTVEMFDIPNNSTKKQMNKNVIDAIFDEIPKMELPSVRQVMTSKNRHIFIIFILMMFILSGFILISAKSASNIISEENEINEQTEEYNNTIQDDYYPNNSNNDKQKLINLNDNNAIKQASSETKNNYTPSVEKISWEAPEDVMKKEAYINFLKSMGKNVKLNLQNDLLLVNDIPINKISKVDIKILPDGNIESVNIIQPSGSKGIDDAIIKVVNDTLKYMRPPALGLLSVKTICVTLVLELK